ncbi:hypothetical protein M434DRAFT_20167 [Hypoxylon sp. CO27-5]|nr:hypothetical protein M434DRAFT_20167 [Hypoxylon sp. CO27-5]
MASQAADAVTLTNKIETLIDEVQSKATSLSEDDRYRVSEAARKLSMGLETPGDTVLRVTSSPLQLPLACIGVETRLFEVLSEIDSTATIAELAERKRLLRYYQAFGFVSQPGDDAYSANDMTRAMTSPAARASTLFSLDTVVLAFNILPQFLGETGYADISGSNRCPWNSVYHIQEDFWTWLQKHPLHLQRYLSYLQNYRFGLPSFVDVVNIEQEIALGSTDSTVLFMDLGGAMGHNCIALRRKYPKLPGRIVLQDLPDVIERVKTNPLPDFEGIEAEAYDFFTPRPLKGARAYYLSSLLHDWPDHKCVVLPERGTPWRAAQSDLAMLSIYYAGERSYADWVTLLGKAGLKISKVWEYTERFKESVTVAVLK